MKGCSATEASGSENKAKKPPKKESEMNRIKNGKKTLPTAAGLAMIAVFIFTAAAVQAAENGNEILKKSDELLIPGIFSYNLTMTSVDQKGKTEVTVMHGWKSGIDRNVMIYREPRRVAGSVNLRRSGMIWVYYTTNKKVTQMGYQAIFMGSLLNYGDVMSAELSTDYDVIGMQETASEYILTLRVKPGREGYDKILVTMDKTNLFPKSREYYALSGVLMKTCIYTDIERRNGVTVSMKQEFFEPLKNQRTFVEFSDIELLKSVPEKYYNNNYISRFGE